MDVEIRRYRTLRGTEPFTDWISGLHDRGARARILVRIERVALGNLGDAKPLRQGVWELRIDTGPGYRVYFAREGRVVVILLGGGDKRTQDADIEKAIDSWDEYRKRRNPNPRARP